MTETQQLLRWARQRGWRVEKRNGGHWAMYAPNGRDIVHLSDTPGNPDSTRYQKVRMERIMAGRGHGPAYPRR